MYTRRSGRIYPDYSSSASPNSVKQLINPYSVQQSNTQLTGEDPLGQTRYFNSPMIQQLISDIKDEKPMVCKVEPPDVIDSHVTYTTAILAGSATEKALNKLGSRPPKKKIPRKVPMPMGQKKKKKVHIRLSRLLVPKSGVCLLNSLKRGCVYTIKQQPGCFPPSFFAQVEFRSNILGTGQGLSRSEAKNRAAENAIKIIVSRSLSQKNQVNNAGVEGARNPENLPWAGLASFALHKMFSEWQSQGIDLSAALTVPKKKTKNKDVNGAPPKKVLPPNATECHPTAVLTFMHPGITAVELEREDGPKCKVKVGFTVDGQMFTGISGNKKDAKREAAKAALLSLYGLTYPS